MWLPYYHTGVAEAMVKLRFSFRMLVVATTLVACGSALGQASSSRSDPLLSAKGKVVALYFVLSDCPVANGYAPTISKLAAAYSKRGVECRIVYVDPGVTEKVARKHADDYGYQSRLILDPKLTLAKRFGVTVSPEAVVLGVNGKVAYRGRIDNRVADLGKVRPAATIHDLRDALDAVLAGKKVVVAQTTAVGCVLPVSRGKH